MLFAPCETEVKPFRGSIMFSSISRALLADDTDVISIMGVLWTENNCRENRATENLKLEAIASRLIKQQATYTPETRGRVSSWVDENGGLYPVLTARIAHGTSSRCNRGRRMGSIPGHWHLKLCSSMCRWYFGWPLDYTISISFW